MTTIAFFIMATLPWAGGPALVVLAWCLWRLRYRSTWRAPAIALSSAAATYTLVAGAYLSLLLRDGLGPGFEPSEGLVAVLRFSKMVSFFVGIALIPTAAAFLLAGRSSNPPPQPPGSAGG